ncbi:hypothetical protein KGO95_01940 [Patescibacteria group bacterium]|nr:hypothetical protein [Patescibacteria group bacterium]
MNDFEKLMKREGMEKVMKPTAEAFEQLMRKSGLEGIAGKEGEKFIVRGKDEGDSDFKVLAEFDTAKEAEEWYGTVGQLVIEGGGALLLEYGPSELHENKEEEE